MNRRITLRRSREDRHLPPITEISYTTTFGALLEGQVFTWEGREYVMLSDKGIARDVESGGLRTFIHPTPVRIVTKPKP